MQLPKRDGNFFNLFEDLKPPGESKSTSKGGTSSPSNQQPIREEFVVLGYESRMFRNDKQFDSTEQFIPWMGNTDLLIDRYDARALLTDLKLFDRKAGRWDTIPRKERKPSDPKYHREQKLNKKLNKERYWDMALHMEDVYKGKICSDPSKHSTLVAQSWQNFLQSQSDIFHSRTEPDSLFFSFRFVSFRFVCLLACLLVIPIMSCSSSLCSPLPLPPFPSLLLALSLSTAVAGVGGCCHLRPSCRRICPLYFPPLAQRMPRLRTC